MFLKRMEERAHNLDSMISNQALKNTLQLSGIFDEIFGGENPIAMGVCGCASGAGATSIATMLALMLQDRIDEPVALVEANLRTPSLSNSLKLADGISFNDFANGIPCDPGSTAKLSGTNLYVIPANIAEKPLATMNSARKHIDALRSSYRHTIVDLPPLLSSPDARIFGPDLDGIIMILEAEETRWQVAKESKHILDSAGVNLLGTVLNKKHYYIPSWLYQLL